MPDCMLIKVILHETSCTSNYLPAPTNRAREIFRIFIAQYLTQRYKISFGRIIKIVVEASTLFKMMRWYCKFSPYLPIRLITEHCAEVAHLWLATFRVRPPKDDKVFKVSRSFRAPRWWYQTWGHRSTTLSGTIHPGCQQQGSSRPVTIGASSFSQYTKVYDLPTVYTHAHISYTSDWNQPELLI